MMVEGVKKTSMSTSTSTLDDAIGAIYSILAMCATRSPGAAAVILNHHSILNNIMPLSCDIDAGGDDVI